MPISMEEEPDLTAKKTGLINPAVIASGVAGPHVLIIGGVHGDEYEPMLAAMQLAVELRDMLTSGKVTLVTVANESAYCGSSRYGEDGKDLARVCPGDMNGSVTERVAGEVSALIRAADYVIDMHTGGLMFSLFPLAGYMLHRSPDVLEKQQEMADVFNLPLIWGTDHRPDGRTLSVARDAGIPAIYVEYGGGTGVREHVIEAYKRGCLNVLRLFKMVNMDGENDQRADKFWLEDHRADSGFLQGKMPAPADGIFVAAVNLGDTVKAGQLFGNLIDPLSGQITGIPADTDGLVFMLRTTVKVNKGETMGGILPVLSPGKKIIYDNE